MKFRVTGLKNPQYSRAGLLKPGDTVIIEGLDQVNTARKIKYLKPVNEKKEQICQKKEKQSLHTKKPLYGGQKLYLTKQKESC